MKNYKVTKEDLKGEIKSFPIEVVQKMVDYQEKQNNKADVHVFQSYACASKIDGGFDWPETEEGLYFWTRVINCRNFSLFFDKDPSKFKADTVSIGIPEGYEIDIENTTPEKIMFRKKKEIKKWEDLLGTTIPEKSCYISDYSKILNAFDVNNDADINKFIKEVKYEFIDERHAKSALAMAQISQLMPYYGGSVTNEEWEIGNLTKYCMYRYANKISFDMEFYCYQFLAFHTEKQRDEFLKNNEQLVKDYLMIK